MQYFFINNFKFLSTKFILLIIIYHPLSSRNEANGNDDEASNFVIEAHHASIENMSFYGQAARNFYINQRSASAEDRLDTTTQSITSTQEINENGIKEAPISVSFSIIIFYITGSYLVGNFTHANSISIIFL